MKKIFVIILLLLSTNIVFSQASSSTEFEFEIKLPDVSNNCEYEFYSLDYAGVNTLSRCKYRIDAMKKSVNISGHLDYIVGADVLTLIIAQKTTKAKVSKDSIEKTEVLKHYVVNIGNVRSVSGEVKSIGLKIKSPFIEIGEKFVENKFKIYTNYYEHIDENGSFANIVNRNWININEVQKEN